ncbi:hypothetical protein D0Z07_3186 [Hyphodiscus hymeniophilus]|uniref:DUF6594 domain-containing protein n=1 Tax=Hyphodiscus hymeniophilus TaxID=353542 RepID=A0A9P6VM78_9HELO|nr:hypothetical protein D0Z07_3186 [Hyphodiscus hymeniophilus]
MKEDSDLWVFRRFGQLHLFNLLHLQQHLAQLQYNLERQIGREHDGQSQDYKELVLDIKRSLAEYDQALAAQATLKSYKKATPKILELIDWVSLNFGGGNCTLLLDGLGRRSNPPIPCSDLISVALEDKTLTHRFIDKYENLRKRFTTGRVPGAPIYFYSEGGIRFAEEVIINAAFCLLLIGPVIVLSYLTSKMWKLIFISLCLLVASAFSGGFLNAPNKTGLGLVAGYAAVLVVFLSTSGGS